MCFLQQAASNTVPKETTGSLLSCLLCVDTTMVHLLR